MEVLITLFIFLLSVYIIADFRKGMALSILLMFVVPNFVRFNIGFISIAIYDFLLIPLTISYFLNLKKPEIKAHYPKALKKYILFYYGIPFILIFLATAVPFEKQLGSYLHSLISRLPYFYFAYFALRKGVSLNFYKFVAGVFVAIASYGIICYVFKSNPYIESLATLYNGEYIYAGDMTSARGGLSGRVSGTANQALTWGQYWILALSFYVIVREKLNNKIFDWLVIGLGVINIVICGSRTAIASSLIILFFYVLSMKERGLLKIKKLVLPLFVFSLLFIVLLAAFPGIFAYIGSGIFFWDQSYSENLDIGGSSVAMRQNQLFESIDFMKESIWGLGNGAITYFEEEGLIINAAMMGFESIVFLLAFEQGVLGIISFFASYWIFYKWVCSLFIDNYMKKLVSGYFASYMVSILMTGNQNSYYIFLLTPFLLMNFRYAKENYEKKRSCI